VNVRAPLQAGREFGDLTEPGDAMPVGVGLGAALTGLLPRSRAAYCEGGRKVCSSSCCLGGTAIPGGVDEIKGGVPIAIERVKRGEEKQRVKVRAWNLDK
jgi:hypothetical protein